MEAQSSSELLLSRKRRREGSNGETEEGERLVKIPRCTVVSQLCASAVIEQRVWPEVSIGSVHVQAPLAGYICMYVHTCLWYTDRGMKSCNLMCHSIHDKHISSLQVWNEFLSAVRFMCLTLCWLMSSVLIKNVIRCLTTTATPLIFTSDCSRSVIILLYPTREVKMIHCGVQW